MSRVLNKRVIVCAAFAMLTSGCSNPKPVISDHSGDPEYSQVVGKVDFIDVDCYLYRDRKGNTFIDATSLGDDMSLLMTLKGGTQVRIEKVIKEERQVDDALFSIRCYPIVSFTSPDSNDRIVARIDFRRLQNTARLHSYEYQEKR